MKMKKIVLAICVFAMAANMMAADHVMDATKRAPEKEVPASLNLSLEEAQDYAVSENRSLRNASLAVQKAYASRWQTIASMLPQLDMSWAYQSMMGYEMEMRTGQKNPITGEEIVTKIAMPDNGTLGITASVGINGQAIVGALLNNVAIEMQKLNLEISEDNLRASVKSSYASVLVLQDVVKLLDSSLENIEHLAAMTQRSVEVGAAEQTTADQILVRVNTLKNNINANKRSTQLAINALKVLLNVPAETITGVLNDFVMKNGRNVRFTAGPNEGFLITSKHENSTSYNQSLSYVAMQPEHSTLVIIVDAISRKYYTAETSWLWDISFEMLEGSRVRNIILTGKYAYDLAARFELANITTAHVIVEPDLAKMGKLIAQPTDKVYAVTCFSDKEKLFAHVQVQSPTAK